MTLAFLTGDNLTRLVGDEETTDFLVGDSDLFRGDVVNGWRLVWTFVDLGCSGYRFCIGLVWCSVLLQMQRQERKEAKKDDLETQLGTGTGYKKINTFLLTRFPLRTETVKDD